MLQVPALYAKAAIASHTSSTPLPGPCGSIKECAHSHLDVDVVKKIFHMKV
jgi:hypothetical protein